MDNSISHATSDRQGCLRWPLVLINSQNDGVVGNFDAEKGSCGSMTVSRRNRPELYILADAAVPGWPQGWDRPGEAQLAREMAAAWKDGLCQS